MREMSNPERNTDFGLALRQESPAGPLSTRPRVIVSPAASPAAATQRLYVSRARDVIHRRELLRYRRNIVHALIQDTCPNMRATRQ